jgi:ankyrin repeat protein
LSDDGWTALHLACNSNDIFEYLVSIGASTKIKNKNGVSLMHKAAFDDNTYLLTYLRDEHGHSVSDLDHDGNTPLHFSCTNGAEWASFWLMGFGSDVNAANKNLDTPMHLLIKHHEKLLGTKTLRELIFKGADKTKRNKQDKLAIDFAPKIQD